MESFRVGGTFLSCSKQDQRDQNSLPGPLSVWFCKPRGLHTVQPLWALFCFLSFLVVKNLLLAAQKLSCFSSWLLSLVLPLYTAAIKPHGEVPPAPCPCWQPAAELTLVYQCFSCMGLKLVAVFQLWASKCKVEGENPFPWCTGYVPVCAA